MANKIRWQQSSLSDYRNCALAVVYDYDYDFGLTRINKTALGTGYFIAGFINTPRCCAAYHALQRDARIIYQSEVRRNNRSGNDYFFCVFDANV